MAELYHSGFYAMGTRLHAIFPRMDAERGAMLVNMMRLETGRIESLLSIYRPRSEISMVNKMAIEAPVTVSSEVFRILETCREYHTLTRGAFDISMGGMQNISLDSEESTIFFKNKDVRLNFGGFGKGYALERMRTLLTSFNVENAFISFGESTVLGMGRHPSGEPWRVGPKDLNNPEKAMCSFDLTDASMSTSANIKELGNGKTGAHDHIKDPATGHALKSRRCAAVVAGSALVAEILSTAVCVNPGLCHTFPDIKTHVTEYD
jgi:FAD:protein FMN transferase